MKAFSPRDMCPSQSFFLLVLTLPFMLNPHQLSVYATVGSGACRTDSRSAECDFCSDTTSIRRSITKLTVLPGLCASFRLMGITGTTPFLPLRRLETLIIRDNTKVSQLRMAFNFGALKYIDLSNNSLVVLSTRFPNSVKELNLADNQIVVLEATSFTGLSHLEKLDLSRNPFNIIENGVFATLNSIEEIRLNGANVSFPPDRLFYRVTSLKRLYMSGCNVYYLPHDFLSYTCLEVLDLSNNNLQRIPVWTLRGTKRVPEILNLSFNKIWEMWDMQRMTMDVLDLHGNPLSVVKPRSFLASKISNLILSGTVLKILPSSMDAALKAGRTTLNLDEMDMTCNCSMLWLSRYLETSRQSHGPKCGEFGLYTGQSLVSVKGRLEAACVEYQGSRHMAYRASDGGLGNHNTVHVLMVSVILIIMAFALPTLCWIGCCLRRVRTEDED